MELAPLLFLIFESKLYKIIIDDLTGRGIIGQSLVDMVKTDYGGSCIRAAEALEKRARTLLMKMQ